MDDEHRRHAQQILQQSEDHFRLSDQHQAKGAALYKQYRELMKPEWEGYTIGEGEG